MRSTNLAKRGIKTSHHETQDGLFAATIKSARPNAVILSLQKYFDYLMTHLPNQKNTFGGLFTMGSKGASRLS